MKSLRKILLAGLLLAAIAAAAAGQKNGFERSPDDTGRDPALPAYGYTAFTRHEDCVNKTREFKLLLLKANYAFSALMERNNSSLHVRVLWKYPNQATVMLRAASERWQSMATQ